MPNLPTIIIVSRTERPNKCTVLPLRDHPDIRLIRYPFKHVPDADGYVQLAVGAPLLTSADQKKGLLILDGTWRRVARMATHFPDVVLRGLPPWKTAYPRASRIDEEPEHGLASVEALFAALTILGRNTRGILDHYHWRENFLELNRNFIE